MPIEKLPEFAKDGQKNTDELDLETGFIVNRKPARQWFNWLFNTLALKINDVIDKKLDSDANAASATKLATARSIGGVNFDGTANINLPGVNETGNQNTTGNAATATKLLTARKFNGISFDGTKDITVADDTKLPLSGGTVNGTLIASKLEILNLNQAIANGDNYTITYDYATRLAHIQMRVFTNQPIYLGLPYSGSSAELYFRDVTLPITLKKRLFTDVFFTAATVGVGQMQEAYEWMWWTPPAGSAGSTDSKVRISARRLSGNVDEVCHCDLYVTGYF